METVASIKAKGAEELRKQKLRGELMITRTLILTLDTLVEALVDRLENPNKAGILNMGKPAPPAEGDATFSKCKEEIGKALKSSLFHRADLKKLVGPEPPQYEKLRKLLPPGGTERDNYSSPYANFLDGMFRFITLIQTGGYPSCAKYQRVINLLMRKTTDEKYKFDFDALSSEIARALKPFMNAKEQPEINAVIDEFVVKSFDMPQVPTGAPKEAPQATPEEPLPDIPEADIEADFSGAPSAAVGATPVYRTPLQPYETRYIRNVLFPKFQNVNKKFKHGKTDQQLMMIAELSYRKKAKKMGGQNRKTYRKKKAHRKSRKVRRV